MSVSGGQGKLQIMTLVVGACIEILSTVEALAWVAVGLALKKCSYTMVGTMEVPSTLMLTLTLTPT